MTIPTVIHFFCSFNKFSVPITSVMESKMSDAKKFGEFVCIIKIKLAKGNLNSPLSVLKIAKPVSGN